MKKWNKVLAFLLAFALVITTFGSDLASTKVFADEGDGVAVETEIATVEKEAITEENSIEAVEAASVEEAEESVEEATAEADSSEDGEDSQNEEEADAATEATTEEATDEATKELTEKVEAVEETAVVIEKEFNQDTIIDGIRIALYAEPGVLPADAELRVEKVAEYKEEQIEEVIDGELGEDKTVEETYSYDINIYSPSLGDFVQPVDGTVEVRFEQIAAAASSDTELAVFHVEDDLSGATQVASAGSEATDIEFDAEHFSIYTVTIVVATDESKDVIDPVAKYNTISIITKDVDNKTDDNEIGFGTGTFELTTFDEEISVDSIAPFITDYEFEKALVAVGNNFEKVLAFKVITGSKLQYKNADGTWKDYTAKTIEFYYRKASFYGLENAVTLKYLANFPRDAKTTGGACPEGELFDKTKEDETFTTKVKGKNDLSVDGYEFKGWLDDQGKEYQEGDSITLSKNMTLRAIWKKSGSAKEIEIIFLNDDNSELVKLRKPFDYDYSVSDYGKENPKSSKPEGEKYRFTGWSEPVVKKATDGDLVGRVTYTAQYSNKYAYTVKYFYNNKLINTLKRTETIDTTIKVETLAKKLTSDFSDASWVLDKEYYTNNGIPTEITISDNEESNVVYVYFTDEDANKADVFFYVLLPKATVPRDASSQSVKKYFPTGSVEHVSPKLYKGKAVAYPGESVYDISGLKDIVISSPEKELYKSDEFQKIYKDFNGLNLSDFDYEIVWYVYKAENKGYDSDRKQYIFDSYHIDGYVKGAPIEVKYVANFDGHEDDFDIYSAKTGEYTVLGYDDTKLAKNDKQYFVGWNTSRDGSGTQYSANEVTTLINSTTLYAQWRNDDKCTVIYKDGYTQPQGDVTDVLYTKTVKKGSRTPTTEDPKRDKFIFTGWKSSLDGKVYQTSEISKLILTQDVTYTAQWKDAHKTVITIKGSTDGKGVDTTLQYNGAPQEADMNFTIEIHVDGNQVASNSIGSDAMDVILASAKKVLSLGSLTVYAADESTVYGETTTKTPTKITKSFTYEGVTYTVEIGLTGGVGTDVLADGKGYPIVIDSIKVTKNAGGTISEVTNEFDIDVKVGDVVGHLYITPRTVNLKSVSDSKTYDGNALVNNNFESITGDGFAKGEGFGNGFDITWTGSQTTVGWSYNTFSYSFGDPAVVKTKAINYKIVPEYGTLTVSTSGGGNPPSDDDNPPSSSDDPTPVNPPVGAVLGIQRPRIEAAEEAQQVLGAKRPQVLGARRGRTEDGTNTLAHIITIICAAGVAFGMIALRKKKEDDNK